MLFKFILNILYNIGIFVSFYFIYWGYQHGQYAYIMGAVFTAGILIILKLRLMKEVRNMTKNP